MAIKRRGLGYAAVFVFISGFLRLGGPGAAPSPRPTQPPKKETQPVKRATSSYPEDVERTVRQFFDWERNPDEDLNADAPWTLPPERREKVRFVIATLPDPVHTHLGLLFDRSIAAIQLAAQQQGYVFDRAILPWDRSAHQDTDLEKRQKEIDEQRIRESYPGLLIFREGVGHRPSGQPNELPPGPLFVFVVGETPTSGVRGLQFREALILAAKIRGTHHLMDKQLSILGPASSGSLVSLNDELNRANFQRPYVFSGTVTDSSSTHWFESQPALKQGRFASFQQNDRYLLRRFVDFVCAQRYDVNEVAVLSEDNTEYGASQAQRTRDKAETSDAARDISCPSDIGQDKNPAEAPTPKSLVFLHFPREISFFRSAYQKATAAQSQQESRTPGRTTLTLDLEDTGSDDDTVAPYGGTQTPLSQEAVMLGIASELQKHHVKFIVLYATDPVDQLFIARYLRTAYPQGRVIITVPDLLFTREEGALLRGVLGLSSYAMVPGLGDRLCEQEGAPQQDSHVHQHSDRLFSSSLTMGVYNAMLGLLALQDHDLPLALDPQGNVLPPGKQQLPGAPYAEYAGLPNACSRTPLAWLTILGQNGFWPVAPLDADPLPSGDAETTLRSSLQGPSLPPEKEVDTPEVWYTAYCLCVLLMAIQATLSWTGSTLADSESGAQFARNKDCRTAFIIAIGAVVLLIAFVALMCARSPFLSWKGSWQWTLFLSVPLLFFVITTTWDLARLRQQPPVAFVFLSFAALISFYLLAFDLPPRSHIYWLPRIVHLASSVSPVVPFLILLGGGYWWTWQSLRGVTLVDFRRPRLPEHSDLPPDAYRISDFDAEALRHTAHPFSFEWQVFIPIVLLIPFAATVVDPRHPVQTVEGFAYDIGYSLLLLLMISVFLGCLLKLARTWFACRHVLVGLDRLPLRRAFGRMKGISWHSMWNPGGSTLRETYKLMSLALENLVRLRAVLNDPQTAVPLPKPVGLPPKPDPIGETMAMVAVVQSIYTKMHPRDNQPIDYSSIHETGKAVDPDIEPVRPLKTWERQPAEAERILMAGIERVQRKMAQTAGHLMVHVLKPFWDAERSPVVSIGVDIDKSMAEGSKSRNWKEDETKPSGSKLPEDRLPLLRVLAEEYVALVYVNFLVTVLLRMRTMIMCAIGLYVFLVLSVNTYPFEPHSALQTLSVILIVLLGVAVGYVYSQMHRDPILSRLTDSEPGELGWDFWLKLLSAAALPLFSLLATQFPGINQLLTSWLQPALEAVK